MDKIKEIRIREKDGSLSDILPIGADARNVEMANGNSVEDEINNKASKVELKTLETKVNNMVDITPIPVSSFEEMTDTSKIYVNTTDGHWYSYNGTEWVDGGVYQATEIEDESITKSKLNFLIRNEKQLFNKDIIIRNSYVSKDNGQIYTVHPNNPQNKYNAGDWIELEYNMCLIFTKLTEEQQYNLLDCIEYNDATPSHAQAIKLKKMSQAGTLTEDDIDDILSQEKPNQIPKMKFDEGRIRSVLPKNIEDPKIEDFVIKAIEHYSKYLRQRDMSAR